MNLFICLACFLIIIKRQNRKNLDIKKQNNHAKLQGKKATKLTELFFKLP